jgi:hypothetical protein
LVLCLGIAPPPESDGMAAPPPPPPPAQGLWHRVVSECLRREPVQHGQQLCQAGAGVRELLLALGEKALGETALGESRSEAVVAATLGGDGHEGWDLAVLSIVDGLGVLQQGVLDDLQLAIRALPAPTAASPSRRRRVLPGRVTVWAQLLSCKALRRQWPNRSMPSPPIHPWISTCARCRTLRCRSRSLPYISSCKKPWISPVAGERGRATMTTGFACCSPNSATT